MGVAELLFWTGGLSALAGLIVQVCSQTLREPASGLLGILALLYVVHIACSVRMFWNAPRVVIPGTLLLGAVLWTIALQTINQWDLTRAVVASIFIPLATVSAARLLLSPPEPLEGFDQGPTVPTLVHSLLDKGKGLGTRAVALRKDGSPSGAPDLVFRDG